MIKKKLQLLTVALSMFLFNAASWAANVDVPDSFAADTAEVNDNDSVIAELKATITAMQVSISDLQTALAGKVDVGHNHAQSDIISLTRDIEGLLADSVPNLGTYLSLGNDANGYPTMLFSGVNVQVVNGTGNQTKLNGLGNIIVGYNEARTNGTEFCSDGQYNFKGGCTASGETWALDHKTGSHNLIAGNQNSYSQHSGVVFGWANAINSKYAVVTGGFKNRAGGMYSSVSGGSNSIASGNYSSVGGGYANTASGTYSSISGGRSNVANGNRSSISGGYGNEASGRSSSVSGGRGNVASGTYSSISGGYGNTAKGDNSSVSGGLANTTSGDYSSVSGGSLNKTSGNSSSVSGGVANTAKGGESSVSGGISNTASGNRSSILGGSGQSTSVHYGTIPALP